MRRQTIMEIRELVVQCVSQMIHARISNVKSGWKSMFMVFTNAAKDESLSVVSLAYDVVEGIVKQKFEFITETDTSTFTDCVNCLVTFANSGISLKVKQ